MNGCAVPHGVDVAVVCVLGALCADCCVCESHFKHFVCGVVHSVDDFILNKL